MATIQIAPAKTFDQGMPRLMIPGVIGASPEKELFQQVPCLGSRPLHFSFEG